MGNGFHGPKTLDTCGLKQIQGTYQNPRKGPTTINFHSGTREQGSGIYHGLKKIYPNRRSELETGGH